MSFIDNHKNIIKLTGVVIILLALIFKIALASSVNLNIGNKNIGYTGIFATENIKIDNSAKNLTINVGNKEKTDISNKINFSLTSNKMPVTTVMSLIGVILISISSNFITITRTKEEKIIM